MTAKKGDTACGSLYGVRIDWLGCGAALTWERTHSGEWCEGRGDPGVAIRCLDCAAILCPACAARHFKRTTDTGSDVNPTGKGTQPK